MNENVVLSVLAHPDDAEFLCAGALIRLADLGWEVHLASMTPGDCGSMEQSPGDIARRRRAEGSAAAALIGATYHCLERHDLRIYYDDDSLLPVVRLMRRLRPRLVLTHSPTDYLVDHEMTSLLTRAAVFGAPYRTSSATASRRRRRRTWRICTTATRSRARMRWAARSSRRFASTLAPRSNARRPCWRRTPVSANGCGGITGWINTWRPCVRGGRGRAPHRRRPCRGVSATPGAWVSPGESAGNRAGIRETKSHAGSRSVTPAAGSFVDAPAPSRLPASPPPCVPRRRRPARPSRRVPNSVNAVASSMRTVTVRPISRSLPSKTTM